MANHSGGAKDGAIVSILFALNLLILGPYVLADYPNQSWNNGYMYIGMARAFHDYFGGWNPSTYGGAPLRYLYPPVFPGLLGLFTFSPGHAYHLLTGIAAALIPAAIYMLALRLFGSRLIGMFAAVVYSAFPSPAYYFLPTWKALARPFAGAPWGFLALIRYEEAPHGLSLLFAILAILTAIRSRWIWASIFAAVVFLTSWPGTVGLVMALLAVAAARVRESSAVDATAKLVTTGTIAYGLAAFWMTPGFFLSTSVLNRVVLSHNVPTAPLTIDTWITLAVAIAIAAIAAWKLPRAIAIVVCGTAITGAVIVAYTSTGAALLPLPHRYMLEFNLWLTLLLSAAISLAPSKWRRLIAAVLLLAGAPGAVHFLRHAWDVQPRYESPQAGAVYPIAEWLDQHADGSRVMASGELEPALTVWTHVPQVGGSGQGVSNPLIFAAQRQIAFGCSADSEKIAELWLRALNVRYFAAHGAASREYFHWIADPAKFATLPIAWQAVADDPIYRIPGDSEAVIVNLDELHRLPPFQSTSDTRFLEAYVAWAAGKRAVALRWTSPSHAELDEDLKPGEAILVKTNYDRGWRMRGASIDPDPIGFLLLRGAPGRQHLSLQFGVAWDTWAGIAITALTILLLLLLRAPGIAIGAAALVPALISYVVLASAPSPRVTLAERAFAQLQPPIINPEGIIDAATNAPAPFHRGRMLAIYGLNFGAPADDVHVWEGADRGVIEYRSPNQINFRLAPGPPARVPLAVEVNGCRGNSFAIEAR